MGKLLDRYSKLKTETETSKKADRLEAILKGMTTIEGPKGEDGHTPTKDELVEIIEPLIPEPIKGEQGDKPIAGVDYPIPKNGRDGHDGTDGITIKGDQGPPGKDGSPDKGEDIVAKINALELTPDKMIDARHIKNLPKAIINVKGKKGGRMGGGGDIVMIEDLSSQTNGVLLSFPVPYNRKAIMVVGSDFPSVLFENNGFTLDVSRTTLTLQSANPPSSGSMLGFQYVI